MARKRSRLKSRRKSRGRRGGGVLSKRRRSQRKYGFAQNSKELKEYELSQNKIIQSQIQKLINLKNKVIDKWNLAENKIKYDEQNTKKYIDSTNYKIILDNWPPEVEQKPNINPRVTTFPVLLETVYEPVKKFIDEQDELIKHLTKMNQKLQIES